MRGYGFDRDGRGADYTTFPVPRPPVAVSLLAIVSVVALHTLWDVANAGDAFTDTPEPIRGAVVVGVGYLAIRAARAALSSRSEYRRRPGPDIERIDPL